MFKNRNGYWMSPGFAAMFAPDGGDGGSGAAAAGDGATGGDGGDAGNAANGGENGGNQGGTDGKSGDNASDALSAEIARLNAELAKQKAALDKATHEASAANKALKAKMTAEEIAANEEKEAKEAQAKRIAELEKQVARGDTIKSVMGKLNISEEAAGNLADHLYGAADIDNALLEIQKAWQVREAALRKEYGKLTGPGAGTDSNSPEAVAVRRAAEVGKARNAAQEQAQKAMQAYIR